MCLHGSTCHVQLPSDFVVIAALQQQLDNLLLPKAIAIVAAIYLTASPQSRGIFGPDYTGAYIAWGVVAALMVVTWIRATPPENKDKH